MKTFHTFGKSRPRANFSLNLILKIINELAPLEVNRLLCYTIQMDPSHLQPGYSCIVCPQNPCRYKPATNEWVEHTVGIIKKKERT